RILYRGFTVARLREGSVGDSATPGLRGVALFVCAVARADERAREDGAEADRLALLAEPAELVGVHPAVDRRVLRGRLQVLADRGRIVAGAAVGDVVAVDRGDDDVLQVHLRGSMGEPQRLERVDRLAGLARVHVAVAACARAGLAEDLEGRGAAAPALGDVGT